MSPMLSMPIESIDAFRVVTTLPAQLRVWGRPLTQREFVIVRIQAGGKVGTGYAFTRGMELDRVVMRQIAPLALGRPAGAIRAIWDAARAGARMTGDGGIFARGLALVDIALWDLLGQLSGAPLWRMLGGAQPAVPVVAICGYYRADDPVGAVRREAAILLATGYRKFKIPFGEDDRLDVQRVRALRETVGPAAQIGLDASGVFDTIKDALAAWRGVEQFDIDFFEDPFPAAEWELANTLAAVAPVKIAFGESITSPRIMQQLRVDIQRPDATVLHGVTGFIQGIAPALERHAAILPHYYPDLHAPLSGAFGLTAIEESPAQADTAGFGVLRASQPDIRDGHWHLNERPGFGIDWDEDAIARHTLIGT